MTGEITSFLRSYDGEPIRLMEVCGTHTAEIARNGIQSILSPKIRLLSGPGCPVCVTVTSFIDKLVSLSRTPGYAVVTFGDLIRVRGSDQSLNDARAAGGKVHMLYSPLDALSLAEKNKDTVFVFAAVGFETTAPVYARLICLARERKISNLKLLTSLKTMPPVIDRVCKTQGGIDGFLAPGNVSVVTGSEVFSPLSRRYQLPFVVAGFDGEQLLAALYALIKRRGKSGVINLYRSAVTPEGNLAAQKAVSTCFERCAAAWRGIGLLPESGLRLKQEFAVFDAGSDGLIDDQGMNASCCCAQVLTGLISPEECGLYGSACTPETPQGACMVSAEGSCHAHYTAGRA